MHEEVRSNNLLFQSEQHPLVPSRFKNRESYVLSQIHKKAYARAANGAEGLEVLDLGCNNGYGTAHIAKRAHRVVGIDVSEKAIKSAIAEHSAPNITYRMVDGGELPFEDNSFDLVTSFQVIEHVDDVPRYLREVKRVLRASGQVIFTTPNRCIRLEPDQRPWNPFHVREYDAQGLEAALREAFPRVEIEGLFAAPELYRIEYDRAARAKKAGRRSRVATKVRSIRVSARAAAINGAKAVLPGRLLHRLRAGSDQGTGARNAVPGNPDGQGSLEEFMERWSLDDFFYDKRNLDSALDLIAVCSPQA